MRRILLNVGLSSPRKRRPPKHRVRRQRMPREGMLIQMDGSYHRWLGNNGLQFMLLIAVETPPGLWRAPSSAGRRTHATNSC